MATKKAGTILINLKNKQIGLVYDRRNDSYAFPKGHLEPGETLQECAVRETEEETMHANHLYSDKEIDIIQYTTPSGEQVENYMYIAIDDGPTTKNIAEIDKETSAWFDFDIVENKIVYEDLKDFWNKSKIKISEILF